MRKKKGFTLVELLVVVIIVGILAAVSIPIMRGNLMRARASEALATLGMIRTNMRLVLAEHPGNYLAGTNGASGAAATVVPGVGATDLVGSWFDDNDYSITVTAVAFTVSVLGDNGTDDTLRGEAEGVCGVDITINHNGIITDSSTY